MWEDVGFFNVAERIKVREKVISEKPHIVMGSCLDCRQTGLRMDKRCAIEDKVLLNFVTEMYEPSWPNGATFCMNALRMLPLGDRQK